MHKILITSAIMRRGKQIKDGTVLDVGKDITADEAEKFISMECAEEYTESTEEELTETGESTESEESTTDETAGTPGEDDEPEPEEEKSLDEVLAEMDIDQLREALTNKEIKYSANAKEKNLRKKLKTAIEAEV